MATALDLHRSVPFPAGYRSELFLGRGRQTGLALERLSFVAGADQLIGAYDFSQVVVSSGTKAAARASTRSAFSNISPNGSVLLPAQPMRVFLCCSHENVSL